MLSSKNRFIKTIHISLLLLAIVFFVTPEFSSNGSIIVKLFISISLFFATLFLKIEKDKNFIIFSFASIFFFLIQIFYHLIGASSIAIGNYFDILVFHIFSIAGLVVFKAYSPREKRLVFRVFQIVVVFSLITNIIAGIKESGIHELVINYSDDYIGRNIARTVFYNLIAFFITANLLAITKEKTLLKKLFDLVCVVLSITFLITCSPRSTALLLTIVMSILFIVSNIKGRIWRFVLYSFLLLFVLVMITGLSNVVLSILPERVANRFYAIFVSKDSSSIYLQRFTLISNSIKTFFSSFKNFVFGIGYHFGDEYASSIGQHSILTDYPAAYGIFGFVFLVLFFFNLFKYFLKNPMLKCDKHYIIAVSVGLLTISFMSKSFVPEVALSGIVLLSANINPLKEKESSI